jgi:heterodisulfide reductase subunit A
LNIQVITHADIESIEGSLGSIKVKIRKRARSVDLARCTGCGTCVENCPVVYQPVPPPQVDRPDQGV